MQEREGRGRQMLHYKNIYPAGRREMRGAASSRMMTYVFNTSPPYSRIAMSLRQVSTTYPIPGHPVVSNEFFLKETKEEEGEEGNKSRRKRGL